MVPLIYLMLGLHCKVPGYPAPEVEDGVKAASMQRSFNWPPLEARAALRFVLLSYNALTTKTILFVASCYKALYRNCR